MVKWLRLHALNAGRPSVIPGKLGNQIPHAATKSPRAALGLGVAKKNKYF